MIPIEVWSSGLSCSSVGKVFAQVGGRLDTPDDPPIWKVIHGTGSYPRVPNGRHRQMRLMPSHTPLSAPYRSIASYVYWEHDG